MGKIKVKLPSTINVEWDHYGNIYEMYWFEPIQGPFLYYGTFLYTEKIKEQIYSHQLNLQYNRIHERVQPTDLFLNEPFILQRHDFDEYERRFYYFRSKIDQLNAVNQEILLYIGLVSENSDSIRRMFWNEDPVIQFPTFYLKLNPELIQIYIGRLKTENVGIDLVEAFEIFHHKPLLNLTSMFNNPNQTNQSYQIRNQGDYFLLDREFTI